MKVEKGKLVTISYELRINGFAGDVYERVTEQDPAEFLCGSDEMLETFEQRIIGLSAGDEFQIFLPKGEAYGEYNPDKIGDYPISSPLDDNGNPYKEGQYATVEDEEGNIFQGLVLSVTKDTITIDFNHPLADKAIYFTGKILKVKNDHSKSLKYN